MKVVQTEVMAEATCWETMEDSEDRERSARATLEEETTSKINKIIFSGVLQPPFTGFQFPIKRLSGD